jgi:hypothetical protein
LNDKLPIKKIFLTAISFTGIYHRPLIKIGWPLLLTGAILIMIQHLTIGGDDSNIDLIIGVITAIAFAVTLVMAIVGCHRLFIFGPKEEGEYKLLEWTGNEIKYVGWWLIIGFVAGLIGISFSLMLVPFMQNGFEGFMDNQLLVYAAITFINILFYYLFSRWSLVLPASATDNHGKTLSWSWNLSENNGWRLMILIGLLPFTTDLLFSLLPEDQPIIVDLITGFFWVVIGIFEVCLLSLSYSFIQSHQSDDTANQ